MKECLLNNVMDKEFQMTFFPLNLMQSVLLQPKYRIKDGFVTPNGVRNHFKCFLGVIVVIISNIQYLWFSNPDFAVGKPDDLFVFCAIDALLYIGWSLTLFTVNLVQSQNNVRLLLKLQQVYRLFDNKHGLRRFRNRNWIKIGLVVITFLALVCFMCITVYVEYFQVLYVLSLNYFDGNIIFAAQTMLFLEHEVQQWLVELDRFRSVCSEPNHNKLTKYFSEIDQQEKKLFKTYMELLKASKIYKSVFQYSILLLAIEIFVHTLMYIKIALILSGAVNLHDDTATGVFNSPYNFVPPFLWILKNFVLLVHVCVACQRFELAVREADKMSAIVCSYHESLYTLNIQKLCKNVCRLNACARADGGLRAGGVVVVDAALPLRLLALLATYTVVLLQFALL